MGTISSTGTGTYLYHVPVPHVSASELQELNLLPYGKEWWNFFEGKGTFN